MPGSKKWTDHRKVREDLEDVESVLNPPVRIDPTKAPPLPRSFGVDPPVVGDSRLLQAAKGMFEQYPQLRQSISQVIQGPTSGSMYETMRLGDPIDRFNPKKILGVYDRRNKSVGIAPGNPDPESTMLHEAGHSRGLDEINAIFLQEKARNRKIAGK